MAFNNVFNLREGRLSYVSASALTTFANGGTGFLFDGTGTATIARNVAYVEGGTFSQGRDLRTIYNRGDVAFNKKVRERPWSITLNMQYTGGFTFPDYPINIEWALVDEFGGANGWWRFAQCLRQDFEVREEAEVNMARVSFLVGTGNYAATGQLYTGS